ncbi:IpaJ protein, partial [Salmonella enterica subsp. enterica]
LHWVLQRPDGSFMDPGVGKNSLSFDELVQNSRSDFRFAGYYDTGISIVLSA